MFELAHGYATDGMTRVRELQEPEFALEDGGLHATRHQREVGTGYFDEVRRRSRAASADAALKGSTEEEQFEENGSGH